MNKIFNERNIKIGLIINWRFHKNNKWVSALTPNLINEIIKTFNPLIISSKLKYLIYKSKLEYIISLEPGWAAPIIKFDKSKKHKIFVFISDPHKKKDWLINYVTLNNIDYILSYYYHPFFFHFPDFPKEKVIHFPWAIPDELINNEVISVRNNKVIIFGGKNNEAYDIRNWCRSQSGIISFNNSGVENKTFTNIEYFKWLRKYDAIVAAGSSDPKFDLVTPKYFEIASSGSLLFAQYCRDLELLGFNNTNCVIFNKDNFNTLVSKYKSNPEGYIELRKNGINLIRSNHTISERIKLLKKFIEC